MMMKKVCAVLVLALMVLVEVAPMAEAANCSPVELSPCLGAISNNTPPSASCCQKLKEQKPCLCGYLNNPALKPYVNSPGAKKVASSCGVPYPSC
ncbi:hypothetical protein PIB30_076542 [Stylosanthes scabra]|uniref:Bifunctional inhibitor/plant lipid transfer protein/seed storage helical domain-containing protein n=1 Tax=Stylosanthes scabra TaxID=79078 RepID=A0ABU6RQL0_9FABA|nr:hypothetical protein [Stylosanthes scabra]